MQGEYCANFDPHNLACFGGVYINGSRILLPGEEGVGGGHPQGSGAVPGAFNPLIGGGQVLLEKDLESGDFETMAEYEQRKQVLDEELESALAPTPSEPAAPLNRLASRLHRITSLIDQYTQRAESSRQEATALYGEYPWDVDIAVVRNRLAELNISDSAAASAFSTQYRQAMEHALHAEIFKLKVLKLMDLEGQARAELSERLIPLSGSVEERRAQLLGVNQRIDDFLSELPDYAVSKLSEDSGSFDTKDPLVYIMQVSQAIRSYRAAIPYVRLDASLKGWHPVSDVTKATLEQINNIAEKDRDPIVYPYFNALANRELARLLDETRVKLETLQSVSEANQIYISLDDARKAAAEAERAQAEADHAKQLQEAAERAQREQQALNERLAALEREEQKVAQALAKPGALAVTLPVVASGYAVAISGNSLVSFPPAGTLLLRAAIRSSLVILASVAAGLITSAPVLLAGLVVGTVALLLPTSIGNSERRGALMLPLSDVDESLDFNAVQHGEALSLRHAVYPKTVAEGLTLAVVASPSAVLSAKVIDLVFNADTGVYHALADGPPRVITVTPAVKPIDASTRLLGEALEPPILAGPELVLDNLSGTASAGYEIEDVEIFILRYPAVSGLPAVYLAVEKPPVHLWEVGEAGPLQDRSHNDGLVVDHIPSKRAIRAFYRTHYPAASPKVIAQAIYKGAAIVVSDEHHRKLSETFGGRNTQAKADLDASDVRVAVEENIRAYAEAFADHGLTEAEVSGLAEELHRLNEIKGYYP